MMRDRSGASLLEAAGGKGKVYMILTDDGSELSILERADTNNPTLHVLKRVQLLGDLTNSNV
jgi:hypothetical protein